MEKIVTIQIGYLGDLQQLAARLGLTDLQYETDFDDDREEYEYVCGKLGVEILEINRQMNSETAGVFTHNSPSFFLGDTAALVISALKQHGASVVSYQTFDDVKSGRVTNVF